MPINPHDINLDLCKALGIDPSECTEITLNFHTDRPPSITVTRYVTLEQADKLIDKIRTYTITKDK